MGMGVVKEMMIVCFHYLFTKSINGGKMTRFILFLTVKANDSSAMQKFL